MQTSNGYHNSIQDDDADRRNRFASAHDSDSGPASLRERAASQPPRSSAQPFYPSSGSPSLGRGTNPPWAPSPQRYSGFSPNGGLPGSVPTRSSSFSSTAPSLQNHLNAMREARAFPSTFEDDESEALSDTYDDRFVSPTLPSNANARGRSYAIDLTRSRSQSLATTSRANALAGAFSTSLGSWDESGLSSGPLGIPGRYGDIQPPSSSRYGPASHGKLPRSYSNTFSSSSPVSGRGNAGLGPPSQQADISNMSPFMRDVGQILLDDGSAFREIWSGMNPPRDENGGGGSGTTSRRHSVSVVQPRSRPIVGFNAPSAGEDEPARPAIFSQSTFGRGGLLLTDEDLADDLGLLNLGKDGPGPVSSYMPPSQPASLPIYAPHTSRSPPSQDRLSPYRSLNLSIPLGSPSESGGSPAMGQHEYDAHAQQQQQQQQQQHAGQSHNAQNLTARFIPGQGIKYLTQQDLGGGAYARGGLTSPVSPTRLAQHQQQQQQSMFSSPIQRRPSAGPLPSDMNELGKGVPLHAVPASCPLYIVEFKAGRTDLFYSTDPAPDIRVGDLVIVEADRGKDLGTVVNDTITLAEVEAFQAQQAAKGFGETPASPGGTPASAGGAKKEINPKMIYGKAQAQDAQLLVSKMQDELKALQLCQTKVRQKKLPMEVVDAEYQWDRRKLTFYFVAEKRIDFRELVRELFRLYKTRIWMASLQGAAYDQ
ncbi:PSP1 C-terminal conserved region-domain-containing protein [Amylostereum chailletii]|nr:PSP1 C-terminal conserved region-domain-containing protein [Amylostereum chailletii]